MFGAEWIAEVINAILFLCVTPILLIRIYFAKKKYGLFTYSVLQLSLPALIISLFNYQWVLDQYIGKSRSSLVFIAFILLTVLVYLYINQKKARIITVCLFIIFNLVLMASNPRMINIWHFEGRENNPLHEKGVKLKRIKVADIRQLRSFDFIKHTLWLEDGRVVSSNVPRQNLTRLPKANDYVYLKKRWLKHGIYTHTLIGTKKRYHSNHYGLFNIPLIHLPQYSISEVELGYALITRVIPKLDDKTKD